MSINNSNFLYNQIYRLNNNALNPIEYSKYKYIISDNYYKVFIILDNKISTHY